MILILIILFLFAMSIRSNIVRYDGNYLFEPDAYYHARLVQDIVQQGYVTPIDPNVYYQVEGGMNSQSPSLYHYISAGIYSITNFGNYNKESLAFSVQFWPIIFGALICVGMYFLGKTIFNSKKIGIIAGFLTAITPAFAYRTMAGAQGDNSLGFLWMVIGVIFLVRALKSDKLEKTDLINSLIAGVLFSLMALSWSLHLLIPVVVIPSILIIIIYKAYESKAQPIKKSVIVNILIKTLIAIGIYTITSYLYNSFWVPQAMQYVRGILDINDFLAIIFGIIIIIAISIFGLYLQRANKETKEIGLYVAIALLYIVLFAVLFMFVTEPDLFYRGGRTTTISLVGEESVGLSSFGIKYNALLILPFVGLFLFPLSLFLLKRKDISLQILLWFWTIVTLGMAWYKLKFTFVFGLGLVMGSILAFDFFFSLLKKYEISKGIESKITITALLFILLIGVAAAPMYLNQFQPFANSDTRWVDTMNWIKDNTDQEANFLNWWGEGHQLAFVTERNFSADNRNASKEANKAYAETQ